MTAVATLAGANLALWTARAIKYQVREESGKWTVYVPAEQCWRSLTEHGWRPDLNWSIGGSLIEWLTIATGEGSNQITFPGWHAKAGQVNVYNRDQNLQFGPTPLIAAMRALVWSVYGDNVPEEVKS